MRNKDSDPFPYLVGMWVVPAIDLQTTSVARDV